MPVNVPLLGAPADWVGWVTFAVFVFIYLINHLIAAAKAANQPQRGNQQQRPNQPQRGQQQRPEVERPVRQAQQPPRPPSQSQLNAEIEQFLKRANERKAEKSRREEGGRNVPQPPPEPPRVVRESPIDIEPIERAGFDSVSSSVNEHLGGRDFDARAEHMVDDMRRADEQREQHFQQSFNRRVGTFGPEAGPGAESLGAADRSLEAMAVAGLLADPANLRQAIILREILDRPIDRW